MELWLSWRDPRETLAVEPFDRPWTADGAVVLGNGIVRRALGLLPAFVLPALGGLISSVVIARSLGPAGFGVYALGAATVTAFASVFGDWTAAAVFRFQRQLPRSSALVVAVGLSTAAAVLAAALTLWGLAGEIAIPAAFATGALVVVKPLMALVRSSSTARYSLLAGSAGLALPVGASLVAAGREFAGSFFWFMAAGIAVQALVAAMLIRSDHPLNNPLPVGRWLRFGLPMAATAISSQVLAIADRFVLALVADDASLGRYAAAYSLGEKPVALFFGVMFFAAQPVFLRNWDAGEMAAFTAQQRRVADFTVVFGVGGAGFAAVAGGPVLGAMFGSSFSAATPVLATVMLSLTVWYLAILLHQPLELASRTSAITQAAVGAAIVNVAGTFILAALWGALGAALATLLSYFAYLLFVRRQLSPEATMRLRPQIAHAALAGALGVGVGGLARVQASTFGAPLASVLIFGAAAIGATAFLFVLLRPVRCPPGFVVHVVPKFAPSAWSGAEATIDAVVPRLQRDGIRGEVWSGSTYAQAGADTRTFPYVVRRYRGFFPPRVGSWRSTKSEAGIGAAPIPPGMLARLLVTPFDLVHLHCHNRLSTLASWILRLRRVPYVLTLHSRYVPTRGRIRPWHADFALRRAQLLWTTDAADIELLRARHPEVPVRFLALAPAVVPRDPDFEGAPRASADGTHVIRLLHVGRICALKNQLWSVWLLESLIAAGLDAKLTILGPVSEVKYANDLRSAVEHGALSGRVIFSDSLPPGSSALSEAYQAADLLLLPSFHEAQGIVVLEAWAHGVPALLSQSTGAVRSLPAGLPVLVDPSEQPPPDEAMRLVQRALAMDSRTLMQAAADRSWTAVCQELRAGYVN